MIKFQTTTRKLFLAFLWAAAGVFCLLQMKTVDVVETVQFISLPNTDEFVIQQYQQISTEPVVVTRRDHELVIKYAIPITTTSHAQIDWQAYGYGYWTSYESRHELRIFWMFWYLVAAAVSSLLTSAWRRWRNHGVRAPKRMDKPAMDAAPR